MTIVIVTLSGVGSFSSFLSLSFITSPTSITLTVLTVVRIIERRKDVREGSTRKEDHRKRRKEEIRRGRGMADWKCSTSQLVTERTHLSSSLPSLPFHSKSDCCSSALY